MSNKVSPRQRHSLQVPQVSRQHLHGVSSTERRLAIALRASGMGVWEWDVSTQDLYWSDEAKLLYGLDPSEHITLEKYFSLIFSEDLTYVRKMIEHALGTQESFSIEHRVQWPNGTVRWLLCYGEAVNEDGSLRMVGTVMNIDDRKRAEIELQESERRFREMADCAPVFIWVTDRQRCATYFNKPWLDFTGCRLEQELGENWKRNVHPDDVERIGQVSNKALKGCRPFTMEYRLRRHDGVYQWLLCQGAPHFSPKGEFLGYIGTCVNINKIKSTQKRKEELEVINRKLQLQQEQLTLLNQSKDEFISLASHQLRTPATGVKQYVGMMMQGYAGKLSGTQLKMLQTAYDSNERQLQIIDDLLRVAHVDSQKVVLEKRKTDVVRILADVIREQSDTFGARQQRVILDNQRPIINAVIDPGRMRMVFENLIDNASKYTPLGKTITVRVSQTPAHTRIEVIDEGVGLAKKDLHKLFHKFSRINNPLSTSAGGTGLGLYWVKQIVRLHDGEVEVASRLHKGSTFCVIIPRRKRVQDPDR